MSDFRLLDFHADASIAKERRRNGQSLTNTLPLSLVPDGVDADSLGLSWVTVITGRNGTGKSRALAAIAAAFWVADGSQPSGRKRTLPGGEARLRYASGGAIYEGSVRQHGGWTVQAESGFESDAPLPRRVIALSTSATDKFPLPSRVDQEEIADESRYRYMGLRDRSGRASATAVAFRALEVLVAATAGTLERRAKIADVFGFLRYAPRVEHTYGWRYRIPAGGLEALDELLDDSVSRGSSTLRAIKLRRMVANDPSVAVAVRNAAARVMSQTDAAGRIQMEADFRRVGTDEVARFRDIQLLKRAGLVDLRAVEVERAADGLKIDLRETSSGELSMASAFLGLAAVIEDGSLVLIDEPEVGLHPEWQADFLRLLMQTFGDYRGCHFIVATHSPLVVSGVPPRASNVVSVDQPSGRPVMGDQYAGDSIDEVLVREFGVLGDGNLFAKQRLVEALRLAADGRIASDEFDATLAPLKIALPNLKSSSPVRSLILELLQAQSVEKGHGSWNQ
ncbi:AAA family ATPase [Aeromicrobium sp. JJY06]|uniref:AAA family ATPase n=1 Tax=Aeromicrobium sp. JJY06 TaxID=3373478 RepID=UPI00376EB1C9